MRESRDNRLYTPEQIREAEKTAMRELGLPRELLMEHAALAVADAVCRKVAEAGGTEGTQGVGTIAAKAVTGLPANGSSGERPVARIAILAGSGNNGADGLAVARLLLRRGFGVTVYEADADSANGAYRTQRAWLAAYRGYPVSLSAISPDIPWERYDVIVDALFGIGLNRELTGVIRETVRPLNSGTTKRPIVVAVDAPSGIDSRTGAVLGEAVRADVTVTFSGDKTGLSLYPGRSFCGRRIVADVGIPAGMMPDTEYSVLRKPLTMMPRDPGGHKGTFGKAVIIAGADQTPGAAMLAAKAAFRSGIGMIKVVSTQAVLTEMLHELPEAIACTRERWLADAEVQVRGYDVIVVGPGLGTDDEARALLHSVIRMNDRICVMDADALNIVASELTAVAPEARIRELQGLREGCIFTPHPAELARLLGMSAEQIAADRLAVALQWKSAGKNVLVMKDAATMVVGEDGVRFNETGNDGMGTAGSGDVLAGICGALAMDAQRGARTIGESAAAAVALHGTAGDIAAERLGRYSMKAGDLIDCLPDAIAAAQT